MTGQSAQTQQVPPQQRWASHVWPCNTSLWALPSMQRALNTCCILMLHLPCLLPLCAWWETFWHEPSGEEVLQAEGKKACARTQSHCSFRQKETNPQEYLSINYLGVTRHAYSWKSQSPPNLHLQTSGNIVVFHKVQYSAILLHEKKKWVEGGGRPEREKGLKIPNCRSYS